jgi:hypothetical protein
MGGIDMSFIWHVPLHEQLCVHRGSGYSASVFGSCMHGIYLIRFVVRQLLLQPYPFWSHIPLHPGLVHRRLHPLSQDPKEIWDFMVTD